MTLVRFNHPGLLKGLANEAYNRNLMDSNIDSFLNPGCNSNIAYRLNEEEDAVSLELVVPGFLKEDIQIELDDNVLTVKSIQNENREESRSFAAIDFEKQFKVSDRIKKTDITARTENGILYIRLPKTEEAIKKPSRTIEIA